jgi:outer membrane protein
MNKYFFIGLISVLVTITASAQRIAVIDTKYILSNIPDYKILDKRIQVTSAEWQKEIDAKQATLDIMYKDYDAEQYMLTDELKKKRQADIHSKEKEIQELQKKRFGYQGDLFKERQNLVKPIQDKVYNAIQKLSVARSYDLVLDKSEGITVIFADPKLDKSDDVLRELGIKVNN